MAWNPKSLQNLAGRVAIVTGGNAGIGLETCKTLVSKNCKVYLGARSESKASAAIEEIKSIYKDADIQWLQIDLSDFSSVTKAAESFLKESQKLNYLINNAGVMNHPSNITKDGFDIQFQTNYLSTVSFTWKLLPLIKKTAESEPVRIVNVSSEAHKFFIGKKGIYFDDINLPDSSGWTRYAQSKVALILFSKMMAKKYPEVQTFSLHPGAVNTGLQTNEASNPLVPFENYIGRPFTRLFKLFFISPEKGSYTTLSCLREDVELTNGAYYVPYGKLGKPSAFASDDELAEKLWDYTVKVFKDKNLVSDSEI